MSKDKLWGGRFTQPTDKFVEEFTASINFDKRLYHQDIRGSIAHATMLGKQGIVPMEDVEAIVTGLKAILEHGVAALLAKECLVSHENICELETAVSNIRDEPLNWGKGSHGG